MSWVVLINTTESHFKYWSFQNAERRWGRIGGRGDSDVYTTDANYQKMRDKLRSGYIVFSENFPTYAPTASQVREFLGGTSDVARPQQAQPSARQSVGRTRRTPTPRPPVRRAPARQTRTRTVMRGQVSGIPVPTLTRNHTLPTGNAYKTDAKGYIKNFPSGYQRMSFENYASYLKFIPINSIINETGSRDNPTFVVRNQTYFDLGKSYFDRIPTTSVYNKPPSFLESRHHSRPSYVMVVYEKGRTKQCVAIYGIHKTQGYCDFFSLKTTANHRTSLLKEILSNIAVATEGNIVFKIKNKTLLAQIKEVANFAVSSTQNSVTYRVIDLRGLGLNQGAKPKRWLD